MKIACTDMREYYYKILFFIILSGLLSGLGGCHNNIRPTPSPGPPATPTIEKKIKWLTSMDDGREEACHSRKLLMLHFYTTWGDWSAKMDKETYTYYKVIDLSNEFVCVKIDLDEHPDLETRYDISGHPTVIFEDPFTEKEIKRIEGIMDRHEMTAEMEEMLPYKVKTDEGEPND